MPLQPLPNQTPGAFQIEGKISAQEALRLEAAEKQIGIGHRGLDAATVADGARIGSGGFRADAQRSSRIETSDGASARADRVNVEHGHTDGQTGNLGLTAGPYLAIDQGNVAGSSAHIERDDAAKPAAARHRGGSDCPARRPGEHRAHWFARRGTEAGDSAARLHDEDASLGAGPPRSSRPAFEALQIVLHHRLQVGVHNHRAGTFVFAELGKDVMGDRKRKAEHFQSSGDGFLSLWVGE